MPRKKSGAVRVDCFKIVPASCQCGGTLAWVSVLEGGSEMMIGCVCHYTPYSLINVPLVHKSQHKRKPKKAIEQLSQKTDKENTQ